MNNDHLMIIALATVILVIGMKQAPKHSIL